MYIFLKEISGGRKGRWLLLPFIRLNRFFTTKAVSLGKYSEDQAHYYGNISATPMAQYTAYYSKFILTRYHLNLVLWRHNELGNMEFIYVGWGLSIPDFITQSTHWTLHRDNIILISYRHTSNSEYLDGNQVRQLFPRNNENVCMFQERTRDEQNVCYVLARKCSQTKSSQHNLDLIKVDEGHRCGSHGVPHLTPGLMWAPWGFNSRWLPHHSWILPLRFRANKTGNDVNSESDFSLRSHDTAS